MWKWNKVEQNEQQRARRAWLKGKKGNNPDPEKDEVS